MSIYKNLKKTLIPVPTVLFNKDTKVTKSFVNFAPQNNFLLMAINEKWADFQLLCSPTIATVDVFLQTAVQNFDLRLD
jgi:hypothetical protein